MTSVFACAIVNALPIFCITSSVYCMIAIAYERYCATVRALDASKRLTTCQARATIAVIWVGAVLISSPTVYEYHVYDKWIDNASHATCGNEGRSRLFVIGHAFFILFSTYIIPLVVIVWLYVNVIRFFCRKGSEVEPVSSGGSVVAAQPQTSVVSKNKIRLVKMFIIVAALFAVSWLPYFVTFMIMKLNGKDETAESNGYLNMLKISLTVFSTSYNAVLYGVYCPQYRQGYRRILCYLCRHPPGAVSSKVSNHVVNKRSTIDSQGAGLSSVIAGNLNGGHPHAQELLYAGNESFM
ncbi:QRFP-like peptide receptor [Tubulanus polymorphus]|uniref:QRFP-like peptide receptor n=1 Tax=Tubulanus polymorphus TaxID=672921 RepID=UPI003DA675B2